MADSLSGTPAPSQPLPPIDPQPFLDPLPGILPVGGISLIAGAPNVGKSALLCGILKCLRDNTPIFGRQPNPVAGIGYINADRGWEKGSGVWFNRVGFPEIQQYSMADDEGFSPKLLRKKHERTDILARFIDQLKLPPFSLISVDPIALFLGGNLINYDDCAVACHEIRAYLKRKQYTMLATAHSGKIKADKKERYMRLQDQILGSTAIFGFTDTQMYLASPQETGKPYFSFLWHPHSAPAEVFQLEQDDQGLFRLYQGKSDGSDLRVLALFPADGSVLALQQVIDAAEIIPLSKATVKRALDQLVEAGSILKPFHGHYSRAPVQ